MASEARGANDDGLKDKTFEKPEPVAGEFAFIQDRVNAVSIL